MKKLIIISIAVLCSMAAYAQSEFGIRGGANMASIIKTVVSFKDANSGLSVNHNPGFAGYAGVYGQTDLSDLIGVRAELDYSANSSAIPADILFALTGRVSDIKCYDIIHTLSLPLLVTFSSSSDRLHFMVGPQLGYNFSESLRSVGSKERFTEQLHHKYIKPFALSAAVGASYLLGESLGVEFRYSHGITPIRNGKALLNAGRQTTMQIGVFYNFM